MDKIPLVNRNQKSNAECCKDYKQNWMMQPFLYGQTRSKISCKIGILFDYGISITKHLCQSRYWYLCVIGTKLAYRNN